MRSLRISLVSALLVGALGGAAWAGGSWIDPYRDSYQPGETVVMRGDIGPGQLGWVDDGPFYAYLRVDRGAGAEADRFPYIAASDLYLGELEITEKHPMRVHVSVTFTIPADLADGEYWVVYCNDPCTTGIGDLMGGWFTVKTPRPPAPPRPACLVTFSALHPI